MLASKLRGDFHLVSANVINHARLTWVHGMMGAMLVRCLLDLCLSPSTIASVVCQPPGKPLLSVGLHAPFFVVPHISHPLPVSCQSAT